MSKSVFNIILVVVGLVVLFFIAQNLINEKKVPSLEDFIASSTNMFASSTAIIASSTSSILTSIASTTMDISTSTYPTLIGLPTTTVFTPKGSLKVFIANNDVTQQQGLSDVPYISRWCRYVICIQ